MAVSYTHLNLWCYSISFFITIKVDACKKGAKKVTFDTVNYKKKSSTVKQSRNYIISQVQK